MPEPPNKSGEAFVECRHENTWGIGLELAELRFPKAIGKRHLFPTSRGAAVPHLCSMRNTAGVKSMSIAKYLSIRYRRTPRSAPRPHREFVRELKFPKRNLGAPAAIGSDP